VCRPQTAVGDKTHQGPTSSDVIIRNNIASGLNIYDVNPNMTMDHNICVTIDGKCQILRYVGGKPKWGVYKPGEYADHNIIDRRDAPKLMRPNQRAAPVFSGQSAAISCHSLKRRV
jgi:hypothetical protein